MDLDKILQFVPTHIEQIIGVLLALFIVTSILLLIRSLREKTEDNNQSLDVGTIEGALKRVLAQNPPTVVEKVVGGEGGGESNIADLAPLKNALIEKERQLAALNAELTEAKAQAAQAVLQGGSAAGGAQPSVQVEGSATAVAALEMEIADLKAKLAEYEIIEDDIADLALYKEENARLKREIEEVRANPQSSSAATATAEQPIVEANPAAGIPGLTEALEEEAKQAAPTAQPQPEPKAQAPAPAPTPAFETIDTDKMLKEAETLATKTPSEDEPEINALSDLLDTDKLLEEVNSLDAQDVMSEFKDKSKSG